MVNQSQITYLTIELILDEPESLTAQSLTLPVQLVILEAQKREVGRSSMARLGAKTRAAAINHLIQDTGIDKGLVQKLRKCTTSQSFTSKFTGGFMALPAAHS